MIKNIYDHSGKSGVVIIHEKEMSISFQIFDYGIDTFDFETLRLPGITRKSCLQNVGAGLEMIYVSLMVNPYNKYIRYPIILSDNGFYYSWEFHFPKE
jgi:hypothetical protein